MPFGDVTMYDAEGNVILSNNHLRNQPAHVVAELIDHRSTLGHQTADNHTEAIAKQERHKGE